MKSKLRNKSGYKPLKDSLEKEAENRRKFLSKLKPEVAKFAQKEFAKLGLFQ